MSSMHESHEWLMTRMNEAREFVTRMNEAREFVTRMNEAREFVPGGLNKVIRIHSGWRRCIGCLKLQVSFRKRATIYRALLRNETCKDKASYASSPPCIIQKSHINDSHE